MNACTLSSALCLFYTDTLIKHLAIVYFAQKNGFGGKNRKRSVRGLVLLWFRDHPAETTVISGFDALRLHRLFVCLGICMLAVCPSVPNPRRPEGSAGCLTRRGGSASTGLVGGGVPAWRTSRPGVSYLQLYDVFTQLSSGLCVLNSLSSCFFHDTASILLP